MSGAVETCSALGAWSVLYLMHASKVSADETEIVEIDTSTRQRRYLTMYSGVYLGEDGIEGARLARSHARCSGSNKLQFTRRGALVGLRQTFGVLQRDVRQTTNGLLFRAMVNDA